MAGTADRQNAVLDAVVEGLRADARSWAAQVRLLAELGVLSRLEEAGSGVPQFAMIELAGSARLGQNAASRRLEEADRLVTALPSTLALLESGGLLLHQARVLLAETGSCAPEVARAVEARLLPAAAELCPADLRKQVTVTVLTVESELDAERAEGERLAERRLAEARAERRTWSRPAPDGMGEAGALLTAEQLRRWSLDLDSLERLERLERGADRDAGVERTADQRRADLFAALPAMVLTARQALADLLKPEGQSGGSAAGGAPNCGSGSGPLSTADLPALLRPGATATPAPAVVSVLVPVATVLDVSRAPGSIPGYGPVSAEHVRLLRPVGFRRVLVDSDTGQPLAVDDRTTRVDSDPADPDPAAARRHVLAMLRPTVVADVAEPQHDPSAHLTRLVDARDQLCAGPGCSHTRCHHDHLDSYPHGTTAAWNVGLLSDRCHQAKHNGWTLVRHPDGSSTWTSPLGLAVAAVVQERQQRMEAESGLNVAAADSFSECASTMVPSMSTGTRPSAGTGLRCCQATARAPARAWRSASSERSTSAASLSTSRLTVGSEATGPNKSRCARTTAISAKQSPPNAIALARSCTILPGSCTAPMPRQARSPSDNLRFKPVSRAVSVSNAPPAEDASDPPPPTTCTRARRALLFTYGVPSSQQISWTFDKPSFPCRAGTSVLYAPVSPNKISTPGESARLSKAGGPPSCRPCITQGAGRRTARPLRRASFGGNGSAPRARPRSARGARPRSPTDDPTNGCGKDQGQQQFCCTRRPEGLQQKEQSEEGQDRGEQPEQCRRKPH